MTDLPHACAAMSRAVDDPSVPLTYDDVVREYALAYTDGGTAVLLIAHCPFCGVALPGDLRSLWLDHIRAAGLDPWRDAERFPQQFRTGTWWRDAGL